MKTEKLMEAAKKLLANKAMLAVLIIGAVLMLLPSRLSTAEVPTEEADISPPLFSIAEQEKRMEEAISSIEGVGKCKVLLSLKGGVERELAQEEGGAIIISAGSGTQQAVETRYLYPEYQGAVIICEGGDTSRVKFATTQAIASLTGLGSDRITVIKMKAQ